MKSYAGKKEAEIAVQHQQMVAALTQPQGWDRVQAYHDLMNQLETAISFARSRGLEKRPIEQALMKILDEVVMLQQDLERKP